MNTLKPKSLLAGPSLKGTPAITLSKKKDSHIVLKAQTISKSDSEYDEKASKKTHDSSYDDSSSDSGSHHSRESKKRVPTIQKIYTPKKKIEIEDKPNPAWEVPIKKSRKTDGTQKAPTKTAVIVSEDKSTIIHERDIQQKLERLMASEDYKQLIQFAEDHILERKDIPTHESTTPLDLSKKDIEKFVEQKLVCNQRKVNYFHRTEPVFGFPLLIKTEKNGLYTPSIVFDYLSFDGIATALKEDIHAPESEYSMKRFTTKEGLGYQYWLPLYINEEHFETTKPLAKNVITRLASGKDGLKEFHPRMILEVLLPLLYRTASFILAETSEETLDNTSVALEIFSQVYLLAKRLLEGYPEFMASIDSDIEAFLKNGDSLMAEEVLLKTLFSSKYSIKDIESAIFKSFLKKTVPQILNNAVISIKVSSPNFLSTVLSNLSAESRMIVVLRELVTLFSNKAVNEELMERYGFLDECRNKLLASRIEALVPRKATSLVDWEVFLEAFGVRKNVKSLKDLTKLILNSC